MAPASLSTSAVQRPTAPDRPTIAPLTALSTAGPAAAPAVLPSLPAIHHLRQLHPKLDDEQLLAIAHEALHPPPTNQSSTATSRPTTFPPLSVIACPGSGKTLTLAARIAFFISYHGIPAKQILAITFTRKAKDELIERVEGILQHERAAALASGRPPPCKDGLRVCTFGSVAYSYVQRYAQKFGWQSSVRVLNDDKAMIRVVRSLVEQAQTDALLKLKPAEAEDRRIRDKAKDEVVEEESDEDNRWDDDIDEEEAEMVRLAIKAEAEHNTHPKPSPSTRPSQQAPAAIALPKLTAYLREQPFRSTDGLKKFVNVQCQCIERIRLRAGLVLKPQTASSPAYIQTPHRDSAFDQRLSDEDDEVVRELLRAYDSRLHASAKLGKGDLIPALLALLRVDKSVLRQVQSEWRAVFVDEVQDSSRSDIAFILALVGSEQWRDVEKHVQATHFNLSPLKLASRQRSLSSHLCLVGDPQQSIYGFRGVDPLALGVMTEVLEQHGLVKLRLSSNYRSTQHIVNTAVAIIASNGVSREQRKRLIQEVKASSEEESKQQPPAKKPSTTASIIPPTDRSSLSSSVAPPRAVPGLKRSRTPPALSCPIARQTASTPPAPAPLPSASMRTRNEEGERIIELRTDGWRQQVRCIIDHVRALTNPRSPHAEMKEDGGWSAQLSCRYSDIAILVRLNSVAKQIRKELSLASVPYLRPPRKERQYDDNSAQEESTTQLEEGPTDGVHVLTVHKAKGLEWPVVFVASFSEGSMPYPGPGAVTNSADQLLRRMFHGRGTDEEEAVGTADVDVDLETAIAMHNSEECRVAYVAVTRARRLLFLCHSREDDKTKCLSPSRYLSYIPAELRRVQDECIKVAGDGARARTLNVFTSAMGPSGASAFISAGSRGRQAPPGSRPMPVGWSSAAGVRREIAAGSGACGAVPSGWTTAAAMAGGAEDRGTWHAAASSAAVDSTDDDSSVGFRRASASFLRQEEDRNRQVMRE